MTVAPLKKHAQIIRQHGGLIERDMAADDFPPQRRRRAADQIAASAHQMIDLALQPRAVQMKIALHDKTVRRAARLDADIGDHVAGT